MDRIGSSAEAIRPGLAVVNKNNASEYVQYMKRFALDVSSLESEWASMSDADRRENVFEFLPTIFIDFVASRVHVSHPEEHYLNVGRYVPPGWETSLDVLSHVPQPCRYWDEWSPQPEAFLPDLLQ
jgi:hypothetical protein